MSLGSGSGEATTCSDLPVVFELQARVAGELATVLGRAGLSGGDRDAAGWIALHETTGDQVDAALVLDHSGRRAHELLEPSQVWAQVEHFAAVLQTASALDGDDLQRLCSYRRLRYR